MNAAYSAPAAGPWWVTSFALDTLRVTIKFKVSVDGYPDTLRLVAIEGGDSTLSGLALVRAMGVAARRYCEQHRETIVDAWCLARGEQRGVYQDAEATP